MELTDARVQQIASDALEAFFAVVFQNLQDDVPGDQVDPCILEAFRDDCENMVRHYALYNAADDESAS